MSGAQDASPATKPALPDSVGILGAGRAGTGLARAIARIPRVSPGAAAPRVLMAATRPPAALRHHLGIYAPEAEAVRPEELAQDTELTVIAVPREDLDEIEVADLVGPRTRAVVDLTNSWGGYGLPDDVTSFLPDVAGGSRPGDDTVAVAAWLRAQGVDVPVLRAFFDISHHDMDSAGRAEEPLRALAVGGDADGAEARGVLAALVAAMGYAPVEFTGLRRAAAVEPEGPGFGGEHSADELRHLLDTAHPHLVW